MLGINGGEFLVLLVVAVIVVGPERLPAFAEQLARFVKGARRYVQDAKAKVGEELGPDMADVDWSKLDPRQYDPRRIVREAFLDDDASTGQDARTGPDQRRGPDAGSGGRTPFDDEAT